ncbi:hypothetical protein U1Q18_046800 [Sarracenia purpurea var. burkii]
MEDVMTMEGDENISFAQRGIDRRNVHFPVTGGGSEGDMAGIIVKIERVRPVRGSNRKGVGFGGQDGDLTRVMITHRGRN